MPPQVPFGWDLLITAAASMVNNYLIEAFLWAVMADLLRILTDYDEELSGEDATAYLELVEALEGVENNAS